MAWSISALKEQIRFTQAAVVIAKNFGFEPPSLVVEDHCTCGNACVENCTITSQSSPAFAAQICTLLAPLLPPHMYTRPLAPRSRRAAMILAAKLPSFGSALQEKQ